MKKNIGLFLILVASIAFANKPESNNSSTSGVHVGSYYQGGIVFWLDSARAYKHGLIVDIKDAPHAPGYAWDTNPPSLTGAKGDKAYAGKANTQAIIAAIGDTRAQAANACATSHNQDYSDWYLPAKAELEQLLINKKNLVKTAKEHGGSALSSSPYWSSTEFRANSAWNISGLLTGGAHDSTYKKNIALSVRCIRSF